MTAVALPAAWSHRSVLVGLALVAGFVLVALAAPLFTGVDPDRIVDAAFRTPAEDRLFGTDNLGRDVFARLLYGGRTSLLVGTLAALASVGIGVGVGAVAGYYGGIVDATLMRITELFQVTPRLVLAIVAVALLGATTANVVGVIALVSWPTTARLVRGQVLSLKSREFVEAARALGVRDRRVIVREVLPNTTSVIIIDASFQVASAVLLEAGLSFLGLGDPNVVSWGQMLQQAQPFLRQAWWLSAFPGSAIVLLVLGLNLLGDGLNDVLNPRSRAR